MANQNTNESPKVYVSTYAKYNNGSLKGAWLELDDYTNHDEFIEACQQLHNDEDDPELMFQDYENFPDAYYSESSIDPDVWEWIDLDDDDREMLEAYQTCIDANGTIEQAQDSFAGSADSFSDWADGLIDSTGMLDQIPENLRFYFDTEAYARDMKLGGDVSSDVINGTTYVFWNH